MPPSAAAAGRAAEGKEPPPFAAPFLPPLSAPHPPPHPPPQPQPASHALKRLQRSKPPPLPASQPPQPPPQPQASPPPPLPLPLPPSAGAGLFSPVAWVAATAPPSAAAPRSGGSADALAEAVPCQPWDRSVAAEAEVTRSRLIVCARTRRLLSAFAANFLNLRPSSPREAKAFPKDGSGLPPSPPSDSDSSSSAASSPTALPSGAAASSSAPSPSPDEDES
mmetsp:Transcript_79484/g.222916  ORF Transcript_79484/g.222916 Transcript_79484/m.222916 type:complete len:222 (-) Transcript_79484:8-673(-)